MKCDGCDILRGVPLSIEKLYEHFLPAQSFSGTLHTVSRDSAKNVFVMYYTVLP